MNKRFILFLFLGIVLLGGGFVLLRAYSHVAEKAMVKPVTRTFVLVVKKNRLVSGLNTLSVLQGDTVIIRITADTDGELHLHGYDRHVDFKKDVQAQLIVQATISGRFVYELEDTKTEIGAMEVEPK